MGLEEEAGMDTFIILCRKQPAADGDAGACADFIVLRDGFSWLAFLFGPLWLLYHRMWVEAAVFTTMWLAMMLLPPMTGTVGSLLLSVLLGLEGNMLRQRALLRRGHVQRGVLVAHDAQEALALVLQQPASPPGEAVRTA